MVGIAWGEMQASVSDVTVCHEPPRHANHVDAATSHGVVVEPREAYIHPLSLEQLSATIQLPLLLT